MPTETPTCAPSAAAPEPTFAHQAILSTEGRMVGYELFDRSLGARDHTAAGDASLLFATLSSVEAADLVASKLLFVQCAHDSLAGGHLELIAPERIVLQLSALPASEADQIQTRLPALQSVAQRGFRLAFDYAVLTQPYAPWLALASYIRLDMSLIRPQSLASFVKLAQAKSKAQLMATHVETEAQHALATEMGITLLQGSWYARPVLVQGHSVRPAQAQILQLINLVRQQASTAEIEAVFKRDPALSFQLLRFINSAGFGLRTEVTSFGHAVMLLGLSRLFKWAALLLTTTSGGTSAAAVGTTAVARGRLMELLATELLSAPECDNAFVVGVFSLLDTMLGLPMEQALANLQLPATVTDALLGGGGPLAPFLELALACESGHDEAFARNVTQLGLTSGQVNWAHVQALIWAESMGI